MTAGFVGADVAQLRDLATTMTGAGSSLTNIENSLTALVTNAQWAGTDASAFVAEWQNTHRAKLRSVSSILLGVATDLRRNASEQESASQSDGGAAGAASGGAAGTAAEQSPEATLDAFAEDDKRDPAAVAEWWNSLDASEKAALIASNPELVGVMDGIDYTSRSAANTETLNDLIADARARGDDTSLEYLRAVKDAMKGGTHPVKQLVSVEAGPPPLAAISVGNLDEAKNASFLIPGMGSNSSSTPGDLTASAGDLWMEQRNIAQQNGLSKDIAVVAWMGYDSPEMPVGGSSLDTSVFKGDLAKSGGAKLGDALMGYDAVRDASGTDSHVSVDAHSYGSTTAADTLASLPGGVVDSFVAIGSAGIEKSIGGASGLHVPDGSVYAIQGVESLPAAEVGRVGSGRDDPSDASWGAVRLNSAFEWNGGSPTSGSNLHDLRTTNDFFRGYLNPGTTSLNNVALVNMGLGDDASRY